MNATLLAEKIQSHALWVRSTAAEGLRLDLALENLHKAQLPNANLVGAKLNGVDFRGARMIGANLRHVDVSNADIRGADLTCADLRGAIFKGSNFGHVKLLGAQLNGTIFDEKTNLVGAEIDSCVPNESVHSWVYGASG
jgi:uncharacterized protein YjbI with pentapeptide repeats